MSKRALMRQEVLRGGEALLAIAGPGYKRLVTAGKISYVLAAGLRVYPPSAVILFPLYSLMAVLPHSRRQR